MDPNSGLASLWDRFMGATEPCGSGGWCGFAENLGLETPGLFSEYLISHNSMYNVAAKSCKEITFISILWIQTVD